MESAALTALFAVIVFVIGQFAQKFILEPVQEQRKLTGEIAHAFVYYANVRDVSENKRLGLPLLELDDPKEVAKRLRDLSSRFRSTLYTIPFYRLLETFGLIWSRDVVLVVSQSLIGWSNSLHSGDPDIPKKKIGDTLKLSERSD